MVGLLLSLETVLVTTAGFLLLIPDSAEGGTGAVSSSSSSLPIHTYHTRVYHAVVTHPIVRYELLPRSNFLEGDLLDFFDSDSA